MAVISGTNRPATIDVLEQLVKVLSFHFDFKKKVHANVELLQSKATRMETYGVNADGTHITLTILAKTRIAARDDYAREFRPVLQAIRKNTCTITYTTIPPW